MNEPYQPISCEMHDYFEIACLHRYALRVELRDGGLLQGWAADVFSREHVEYLRLLTHDEPLDIRLDAIRSIEATSHGAAYGRVEL